EIKIAIHQKNKVNGNSKFLAKFLHFFWLLVNIDDRRLTALGMNFAHSYPALSQLSLIPDSRRLAYPSGPQRKPHHHKPYAEPCHEYITHSFLFEEEST